MEKILMNKGKPGLIVDGYKYRMDKENKSSHLCVKRSCNTRCKTDVNDLMIIVTSRRKKEHCNVKSSDRNVRKGL
jgi:hypothetical protein